MCVAAAFPKLPAAVTSSVHGRPAAVVPSCKIACNCAGSQPSKPGRRGSAAALRAAPNHVFRNKEGEGNRGQLLFPRHSGEPAKAICNAFGLNPSAESCPECLSCRKESPCGFCLFVSELQFWRILLCKASSNLTCNI